VSFAAITFCVASQRVFTILIVVRFDIDSLRKLWNTPTSWGYTWATQSPRDINMETWSSRLGVGVQG
jgi:hypothetical protein